MSRAYEGLQSYRAAWIVDHVLEENQPVERSHVEIAFEKKTGRFLMRETRLRLDNQTWTVIPGGAILVDDGKTVSWARHTGRRSQEWTIKELSAHTTNRSTVQEHVRRSPVRDIQIIFGIVPTSAWSEHSPGKVEFSPFASPDNPGFRVKGPDRDSSVFVSLDPENNLIDQVIFANGRTHTLQEIDINVPVPESYFDLEDQQQRYQRVLAANDVNTGAPRRVASGR